MDFNECIELSLKVAEQFDLLENKTWTVEAITMELSKQVGDLNRLILNREGYYFSDRMAREEYKCDIEDIGNELADILHQVFRLSNLYGVDLLKAHIDARNKEMKYIEKTKRIKQFKQPGDL